MIQYKSLRAAKKAVKDMGAVAMSVYYRDASDRLCIYTKQKYAEFVFTKESLYTRYADQCMGR